MPSSEFDGFKPITDADLRTVFSGVSLRSCELDPLPPFIIIDILDDFAPFFLYLFNRFLAEGCIPASQKRALVFPALKKTNLDPNDCKNYRPISNLSFFQKPLNVWFQFRFFLTMSLQAFSPHTNLVSGRSTQLKQPFSLC